MADFSILQSGRDSWETCNTLINYYYKELGYLITVIAGIPTFDSHYSTGNKYFLALTVLLRDRVLMVILGGTLDGNQELEVRMRETLKHSC